MRDQKSLAALGPGPQLAAWVLQRVGWTPASFLPAWRLRVSEVLPRLPACRWQYADLQPQERPVHSPGAHGGLCLSQAGR